MLMLNAVLKQHRGTAALVYFTHYRPFPSFLFVCLSLLTVILVFLGASIVCINNLEIVYSLENVVKPY